MPTATVTSKGQVTIPKAVRDTLGIGAGDRVAFVVRDDGVVELRPETIDLRELYGALAGSGRRMTIEEMSEGVVEAVVESFGRPYRG